MAMWIRFTIVGLVAYVLLLPLTMPAGHLYSWMNPGDQGVSVSSIDGTAWAGHAKGVQYEGLFLEKLRWKFRPQMLLLGKIEYRLNFITRGGRGEVGVGRSVLGDLYFKNGHINLTANDVNPLIPGEQVRLGGSFQLDLQHGIYNEGLAEVEGILDWKHAVIVDPVALSLGDLQWALEPVELGIQGVLKDLQGPVSIEGVLSLDNDGKYQLAGKLKPREALPAKVRQFLPFLGKPDSQGRFKVDFSGTL